YYCLPKKEEKEVKFYDWSKLRCEIQFYLNDGKNNVMIKTDEKVFTKMVLNTWNTNKGFLDWMIVFTKNGKILENDNQFCELLSSLRKQKLKENFIFQIITNSVILPNIVIEQISKNPTNDLEKTILENIIPPFMTNSILYF